MTKLHAKVPLHDAEVLQFKNIYPVIPLHIYEDDNPVARSDYLRPDGVEANSACGQLSNRLLICMFAVCLLWSTSLQVCVAIVGFNISIPSFSAVVANCNYAYSEVKGQRDSYAGCARRQMSICDKNLDAVYAEEKVLVATLQRQNQNFANRFQGLVGNCSSSVSMLKGSVAAWSSQGVQYTIPYQSNCTGAQRSKAVSILGDSSSSRTSVYSATQAYTISSDSTVVRLAEYSSALSAYNAEYLHNKTRRLQRLAQSIVVDVSAPHIATASVSFEPVFGVLDQLLACTSLANRSSLVCDYRLPQTLLEAFAYRQYIITRTIRDLRNALSKATETFNGLVDLVVDAVTAANNFYDSVQGPLGIIQWIKSNTAGLGNLCGKSTPNYCSFSKASWAVMVPSFPYFPFVTYPVDAQALWGAVSGVEVAERARVAAMAAKLRAELQQWMQDVQGAIAVHADFTPDDYHPPGYPAEGRNASGEAALQAERSSAFMSDVEKILSDRNTTQASAESIERQVNATNYLNLAEGALSEFASSWASFSGANVDFALLIQSVLGAQSLLFLFDYVYRTYQTVRLVSRFWRRGSAELPVVDLRSKKPEIPAAWFVCIARFFDLLPFFTMQLLWLAVLVVLIVWGFAAIYIPEYNSYVNTCVDRTQNDTFISRNLYAVADNFASSDGSGVLTHGLGEYNLRASDYCSSSAASSVHTYTGLLSQLYASNQTLSNNRDDLLVLSACMDLPSLDSSFAEACCRESSYVTLFGNSAAARCTASSLKCPVNPESVTAAPYLPPGYYGASPACSAENLLREDPDGTSSGSTSSGSGALSNPYGAVRPSNFNCQALPQCEITCARPDSATIAAWTKHCSCMAEWYLNGAVLQSLVALLAYLLINVSRVLAVKGIVRIMWRELTPQVFEYTANCDRSGHLMDAALQPQPPGDIETVDDTVNIKHPCGGQGQGALQAQIDRVIIRHERSGRLLLLTALLVNVPWIALVLLVKNNIEYSPDS